MTCDRAVASIVAGLTAVLAEEAVVARGGSHDLEHAHANAPRPIPVGAPGRRLLADLWLDLRLAARMLRKQAGLTAAVVATLALGIGANGAIFAIVDTVLLRELPFPDAGRLVALSERTELSRSSAVSPLNLVDWKERNRSFDAIGG